jgi:hypothetical protein
MSKTPLCKCGCGTPVEESKKKPGTWNRYFSRHGRVRNPEQFKKPPKCRCGCGKAVPWMAFHGSWRRYAKGCVPLITDVGPYFAKTDVAKALGITLRTIERRVKRKALPKPVRVVVPGFPSYFAVFLVEDFDTEEERDILRQVRAFTSRSALNHRGR